MRRAYKIKAVEDCPVTEMAIVNTFTKLIFGEEALTADELSIIDAFQTLDANISRDSAKEMGAYLRDLGVREMIALVSRLRAHIAHNALGESAGRRPSQKPGSGLSAARPRR